MPDLCAIALPALSNAAAAAPTQEPPRLAHELLLPLAQQMQQSGTGRWAWQAMGASTGPRGCTQTILAAAVVAGQKVERFEFRPRHSTATADLLPICAGSGSAGMGRVPCLVYYSRVCTPVAGKNYVTWFGSARCVDGHHGGRPNTSVHMVKLVVEGTFDLQTSHLQSHLLSRPAAEVPLPGRRRKNSGVLAGIS